MINLDGTKFYRHPSEETIEWLENILCERSNNGTLTREIDGDITITLDEDDYDTFEYLRGIFSQAEMDSTTIF